MLLSKREKFYGLEEKERGIRGIRWGFKGIDEFNQKSGGGQKGDEYYCSYRGGQN